MSDAQTTPKERDAVLRFVRFWEGEYRAGRVLATATQPLTGPSAGLCAAALQCLAAQIERGEHLLELSLSDEEAAYGTQ